MLAMLSEILPLFIVRLLALKFGERVSFRTGEYGSVFAIARPDVLIRVPKDQI